MSPWFLSLRWIRCMHQSCLPNLDVEWTWPEQWMQSLQRALRCNCSEMLFHSIVCLLLHGSTVQKPQKESQSSCKNLVVNFEVNFFNGTTRSTKILYILNFIPSSRSSSSNWTHISFESSSLLLPGTWKTPQYRAEKWNVRYITHNGNLETLPRRTEIKLCATYWDVHKYVANVSRTENFGKQVLQLCMNTRRLYLDLVANHQNKNVNCML